MRLPLIHTRLPFENALAVHRHDVHVDERHVLSLRRYRDAPMSDSTETRPAGRAKLTRDSEGRSEQCQQF